MSRGSSDIRGLRADVEHARVQRIDVRRPRSARRRRAADRFAGVPSFACTLAVAACGVAGFARLACTFSGIACNETVVLLASLAACMPTCLGVLEGRRGAAFGASVGLMGIGGALIPLWGSVLDEVGTLTSAFLQTGGLAAAGDCTAFAVIAGMCAGWAIATLLAIAHAGAAAGLAFMAALVACPATGTAPDALACGLLAAYLPLALSLDRTGRLFGSVRPAVLAHAAVLTAFALACAAGLVGAFPSQLANVPQAVAAQAARALDALADAAGRAGGARDADSPSPTSAQTNAAAATDIAQGLGASGVVARGNLEVVFEPMLGVTSNVEPATATYLALFRGSSYDAGTWSARGDTAEAAASDAAYEQYGIRSALLTLTTPAGVLDAAALAPYASMAASVSTAGDTSTAGYRAYQVGTYGDLLDRGVVLTAGVPADASWTSVEPGALPRTAQLVAENPQDSLAGATAFIKQTLAERAAYTTAPGEFPADVDIAEYLLFEGHKGYCQHFATAAVLMYRLYGIPARYVTGFAVPAGDFALDADGQWTAEVGSERAHAWVEVYTAELGWVPVEMTPSNAEGTEVPAWDGAAGTEGTQVENPADTGEQATADTTATEQSGQADDAPSPSPAAPDGTADTTGDGGTGAQAKDAGIEPANTGVERASGMQPSPAAIAAGVLGGVVALGAAACAALALRRRRILARRQAQPANAMLNDLVAALNYAGLLTGRTGTEADFADELAEAVPALSLAAARRITEEAHAAAFGRPGHAETCSTSMKATYDAGCIEAFGHLGRLRRIAFRYLKAFC